MFCHVFLGDTDVHLTTYEVRSLLEETAYVRARLRVQTQRHPTFSVAILHLFKQSLMGDSVRRLSGNRGSAGHILSA